MKTKQRRPRLARKLKRAFTALVVTCVAAASLVVYGVISDGSHDAALAAAPNVSCTTSPNIFNTGYNSATGGQLSGGTDANWVVAGPFGTSTTTSGTTWANVASKTGWGIQPVPGNATWGAANIITDATKPAPWYSSPYANAAWISQEPGSGATQAGPGASWYYKYDFTMDAEMASTYALSLDFFADNSLAEVYVNGVAQSTSPSNTGKLPQGGASANPTTYTGFASGNQSSLILDTGWVAGANSIVVQIYSAPGQEGFLTQAHASAACSYNVSKSVDKPNAQVGDKVTYSVTVNNTGSVPLPYSSMTEATFVDDLSGVLDDATYNNDASGGATYDSATKKLSWAGSLAGGATQVITYSVTVTAGGSGSLNNSVSVPSSNAAYGTCSGTCTVASTVRNTVDAVNDGPLSVNAGASLTSNVRSNDTSATGVTLAAPSVASGPSRGTASVSGGNIVYTPAAGFSGADSYTYTLCDTGTPVACDATPATVSIVVNNVFSPGSAATGTTTPQNTPKTFALSTLASVTGSPLNPAGVTQRTAPSHGSLSINTTTGAVTYTPAAGYSGPDSYQLNVCDQSSPVQCTVITVSLTVGTNAVTAATDTQTVPAGGSVTTNVVTGVSGAGTDTTASGTPLNPAITLATAPAHGTATVHPDGTVTYAPNAGFSGADSYSYRVCDTSSPTPACATGIVNVSVTNGFITPDGPGTTGTPDAPGGAGEASAITPQNTNKVFPLASLIEVKGMPINPAAITQVGTAPHGGTITINSTTGEVVYVPAAGYAGPDSFVLNMCDTATPQGCYTVDTTVTVGPNIVIATDDAKVVPFDQSLEIPIMGNDITQTGQPLDPRSIVILTQPEHGTITQPTLSAAGSTRSGSAGASVAATTAWGSVLYTPAAGYTGTDSFRYRVCDTSTPTAVCSSATVSITISNPTLAFTGQSTAGVLILGLGVLAAGILLLVLPRRRGGKGSHRAA